MAKEGSATQAPPLAPMPTRLIDSTPPPMVRSCWPDITCAAAKLTLSRPEAQKRLICTPAAPWPKPAGAALAQAGREPRDARNVAAGLGDGIDAAHHDVVDLVLLEAVALLDRL